MSIRLYGHELHSSLALAQPMLCNRNQSVGGVRMHLARIGAPAGSLFASIYDDTGTLLDQSDSRAISTLGTAGTDWFGFVPFSLGAICEAEERYWVKLGCSGYTYSSSEHIVWLVEYGFGGQKYTTRTPYGPGGAPFDLEMWENKLITKGTYP